MGWMGRAYWLPEVVSRALMSSPWWVVVCGEWRRMEECGTVLQRMGSRPRRGSRPDSNCETLSMAHKSKRRESKRKATMRRDQQAADLPTWDENFAYIADYTEGGVPFGTTWAEYSVSERETEGMRGLRTRHGLYVPPVDKDRVRILSSPPDRRPRDDRTGCTACGRRGEVKPSECCGLLFCAGGSPFSPYASPLAHCERSHSRYTVCGYHHGQGHAGPWANCEVCKSDFEPQLYEYYASNRCNSGQRPYDSKLHHPRCNDCARWIDLLADGYWVEGGGFLCIRCAEEREELRWAIVEEFGPPQCEIDHSLPRASPVDNDTDDDIPF